MAPRGRATQQSQDTRKTNQAKQPALSFPSDDCKSRMDIKKRTTKHTTITESHNGSNIKQQVNNNRTSSKYNYEGCSKRIAYFYLETSIFKLAKKCSSHAVKKLAMAGNAKLQQMYPLLKGVTVR